MLRLLATLLVFILAVIPVRAFDAGMADIFSRGTREYGFVLGYGENHKIPHAMSARFGVDTFRLRYGRYRSPRTQFAYEVCAGKQTKDMHSTMVSGMVTCRYYFARHDRLVLGTDVGLGFATFGEKVPGLSTTTNFAETLGISFQYVTSDSSALTLDYRFCHISNAGLKLPNLGVNASVMSVGYSWYK